MKKNILFALSLLFIIIVGTYQTFAAVSLGFKDDYKIPAESEDAIRFFQNKGAHLEDEYGNFNPAQYVKKNELAQFLVLATGISVNTSGGPHYPGDVPVNDPYYAYVETAHNKGWLNSSSATHFLIHYEADRDEFAEYVVEAFNINTTRPNQATFTDVPTSHTRFEAVETLHAKDILHGITSTGYGETVGIRRDHALMALYKARGGGSTSAQDTSSTSDIEIEVEFESIDAPQEDDDQAVIAKFSLENQSDQDIQLEEIQFKNEGSLDMDEGLRYLKIFREGRDEEVSLDTDISGKILEIEFADEEDAIIEEDKAVTYLLKSDIQLSGSLEFLLEAIDLISGDTVKLLGDLTAERLTITKEDGNPTADDEKENEAENTDEDEDLADKILMKTISSDNTIKSGDDAVVLFRFTLIPSETMETEYLKFRLSDTEGLSSLADLNRTFTSFKLYDGQNAERLLDVAASFTGHTFETAELLFEQELRLQDDTNYFTLKADVKSSAPNGALIQLKIDNHSFGNVVYQNSNRSVDLDDFVNEIQPNQSTIESGIIRINGALDHNKNTIETCTKSWSGYIYDEREKDCLFTKKKACQDPGLHQSYGVCKVKEGNDYVPTKPSEITLPEQYNINPIPSGSGTIATPISEPISPAKTFFSDTIPGSIEGVSAQYLRDQGIIGGRPDGTFDGAAPVNRAELAKFLLLSKKIEVGDLPANEKFPDIQNGQWYTKYVIKAAEKGIINGYPDGTFQPARPVNTAEFLKMLSKTFQLPENLTHAYKDVDAGAWFTPYVGIAQKYNLFPQRSWPNLDPGKTMTRNEVAVALYKLLTSEIKMNETGTLDLSTEVTPSEKDCLCTTNVYNCTDFATQSEAQATYVCCLDRVGRDIHQLDDDIDFTACENLPS